MKYLWFFVIFLFALDAKAQIMTVSNVKISVTGDSAATAREKALDQAHDLAFQKLLNENFPEKSGSSPSHDAIVDMVTDFSIDREKTTPTSYAASLTFQFDASQVYPWLQQKQLSGSLSSSSPLPSLSMAGKSLKLVASYSSLSEWQHIKRALQELPGIQKINLLTLSLENANIEIVYGGDPEQLHSHLLQKGLTADSQGGVWAIKPMPPLIR